MSDSKGIYQPWSHEEFMADRRVRRMNPIAVKTYMMLLHEAYICSTRPRLPDDEEELELMAYCSDHEEWLSVKETVLGMFEKIEVDGVKVLSNKRLERDWEHLQEIRDAKSEGGKKGAAKRWNRSPTANPSPPMGSDGKEVKEVSKEAKSSEESQEPDNEDTNMKLKDELTKIAASHGAKAGGYKTTWDEIKSLGVVHGTGAVATDFATFMEEYHGDDFPSGAVVAYLRCAADRLTASSAPSVTASKDPAVVDVIREIAYLSDGKVTFQGRHKVLLADLLQNYSSDELLSVFRTFLENKDLEDPYTLKYITGNYLDAADGLAYAARKRKQEVEKERTARDAAAKRLQEEAEAERQRLTQVQAQESEIFDPLAE